jgi:hypothetical protein
LVGVSDEGQRHRVLTAPYGMPLKPAQGGYGAVFSTMIDPPTLYLMTVPRLCDGTVCKNRDKPIKYTVRVTVSGYDCLS